MELHGPGGERREVTVFLSECAPGRAGAETVSDLLSSAEPFFPARDHADDTISFVNRAAVAFARVARSVEVASAEDSGETEHEVEVTLLGGGAIRGVVSYLLAPGHSRVGDFLNLPGPFFRLLASPDELLLVNKQHVARVTLVSP